MAVAAGRAGRFEIGGVVERTFAVIRRNFIPFYLLSLLLNGGPSALFGLVQVEPLAGAMPTGVGLLVIVALPLALLGACLLQAALTIGTVRDLNGERTSLGQGLAGALKVLLPVVGIVVIAFIAFVLACGAVFVPIMATMQLAGTPLALLLLLIVLAGLASVFIVTVPAEVIERPGVFGAFRRSVHLTRDARWRILGLIIANLLLSFVIALVGGLIGMVLTVAGVSMLPAGGDVARLAVNVLASSLSAMITSVGVAAIYYELRAAREGLGPQQLAAVFD